MTHETALRSAALFYCAAFALGACGKAAGSTTHGHSNRHLRRRIADSTRHTFNGEIGGVGSRHTGFHRRLAALRCLGIRVVVPCVAMALLDARRRPPERVVDPDTPIIVNGHNATQFGLLLPAPEVQIPVAEGRTPSWRTAVDGITAALPNSETLLVMGETGTGKFTLLTELYHSVQSGGRSVTFDAADSSADSYENAEVALSGLASRVRVRVREWPIRSVGVAQCPPERASGWVRRRPPGWGRGPRGPRCLDPTHGRGRPSAGWPDLAARAEPSRDRRSGSRRR